MAPFPWWRWTINRRRNILRPLSAASAALALLAIAGCRQDMQDQPKFTPQRGTSFYADGRSARPQVEGTVARGQLQSDTYFETGLENGKEQDRMPFPLTMAVMQRGQERYNIYCTPCHSRVGNGIGMIVMRGYHPAGNFHDPVRLKQPLSHYFTVITNGYGAMPSYSSQVTTEDRWAIAAYIRALQLSQNAKTSDVPAGQGVEDLTQVTADGGYPESFAQPWTLPGTGVEAVPNNQVYGFAVGTGQPEQSQQVQNALSQGAQAPHPNRLKSAQTIQHPDRPYEKQTQWAPLTP